jgi:hypothetical protein
MVVSGDSIAFIKTTNIVENDANQVHEDVGDDQVRAK